MLHQHDPSIFRNDELKNFLKLCTRVAETILHNFPSNMALLIWKKNDSARFNVGAFERFNSPREAVVKDTEAYYASIVLGHVSPLVLSTGA